MQCKLLGRAAWIIQNNIYLFLKPWIHYAKLNKLATKLKYYMTPLIWDTQSTKFIETESRIVGGRNLREGGIQNFSLGKWNNFWRQRIIMRAQNAMYIMPLNCTIGNVQNSTFCYTCIFTYIITVLSR